MAKTFHGFKLDRKGNFNGKPLAHWKAMADELVMYAIVRGINPDKLSLVQTMAAERLVHLAKAIDPDLYQRVTDERDNCRAAIPMLLTNMLADPKVKKASRKITK